MRAVAESAYRPARGSSTSQWFDPWVKRARIAHAREDTLDFVPPLVRRAHARARRRSAPRGSRCPGPSRPGCSTTSIPARAGRDRLPCLKESGKVVNERTTNWTIVPCPTPAWAQLVLPRPRPEARRSSELEAADRARAAARRARPDRRLARARRHARRRRRAAHRARASTRCTTRAPAPTSPSACCPARSWQAARFETVDGIEHMPNLPTEEVFTTPDPQRADGHVDARPSRSCCIDGTVVRGLRVRFEGGRAVEVDADTAQDTMRTIVRARRRRRAARRGRARRRRGPHRQARHGLLRHAARRERRQPHRARPGLPVPGRRGDAAASTRARSTSTS